MGESAELEQLLKNIQDGLKRYSIKDLKDGIISYFNKKDEKKIEIEIVLEVVSEFYGITISTLKKKNVHGDLQDAKQICYCIMNLQLGLPTRYIAERVFNTWHTNVHRGITRLKNVNIALKPDKDFVEKYELLKNQCLDKFKKI